MFCQSCLLCKHLHAPFLCRTMLCIVRINCVAFTKCLKLDTEKAPRWKGAFSRLGMGKCTFGFCEIAFIGNEQKMTFIMRENKICAFFMPYYACIVRINCKDCFLECVIAKARAPFCLQNTCLLFLNKSVTQPHKPAS